MEDGRVVGLVAQKVKDGERVKFLGIWKFYVSLWSGIRCDHVDI